jgi:hypothetical protein
MTHRMNDQNYTLLQTLDVSQWEGSRLLLSNLIGCVQSSRDGDWEAFRRKTSHRNVVWVSGESGSCWHNDCEIHDMLEISWSFTLRALSG